MGAITNILRKHLFQNFYEQKHIITGKQIKHQKVFLYNLRRNYYFFSEIENADPNLHSQQSTVCQGTNFYDLLDQFLTI